jgi:hypothetical protein
LRHSRAVQGIVVSPSASAEGASTVRSDHLHGSHSTLRPRSQYPACARPEVATAVVCRRRRQNRFVIVIVFLLPEERRLSARRPLQRRLLHVHRHVRRQVRVQASIANARKENGTHVSRPIRLHEARCRLLANEHDSSLPLPSPTWRSELDPRVRGAWQRRALLRAHPPSDHFFGFGFAGGCFFTGGGGGAGEEPPPPDEPPHTGWSDAESRFLL